MLSCPTRQVEEMTWSDSVWIVVGVVGAGFGDGDQRRSVLGSGTETGNTERVDLRARTGVPGTGWDCYVDSGGRGWKVRGGGCAKPAAGLAPGRPDEGVWAYVGGDGVGLLC